jgi:catechol 2,3-dioxygenase-like lactoylglutathione lyase family enzyme
MKQATAKRKAPAKKNGAAKAKPIARKPAPAAVALSKISLVIVYVKDPIASLAFYRDLLGMKVLEESPQWVELDGGGVHLALHPHPSIPADRGTATSWVVFQVDDVHGTHQALAKKGATFLCAPKEVCGDEKRAGLSADLKDPDGNPLSIFGYVPRT